MKRIMLVMVMSIAVLLAGCACSTRSSKKIEHHQDEVTTETETDVVVD